MITWDHWCSLSTGKFQPSGPPFQWETRQASYPTGTWTSGWDFPVPTEHQWQILFIPIRIRIVYWWNAETTITHQESDKNSGCYGNLQLPLTSNVEKWKMAFIAISLQIADILTKVLQKYSMSSLLPNISFLSKPLNLIVCHGNRKAKFAKTNLPRSHKGEKAETLQNITLASTNVFIAVVHALSLLWQFKVSTDL